MCFPLQHQGGHCQHVGIFTKLAQLPQMLSQPFSRMVHTEMGGSMSCVPQEVAASQGLASTSSSLTTVHDIEEAIIVLVISVNIRHQSRCTGMQTVLLEAIKVQLLCWPSPLCKHIEAWADNQPGRQ